MNLVAHFGTLLLISFLMGCTSSKAPHVIYYDTQIRDPKPNTYRIPLVLKADVTNPYKVIGTISITTGEEREPDLILEMIREEARGMGADALMDYRIMVRSNSGDPQSRWVEYMGDAIVFEDVD